MNRLLFLAFAVALVAVIMVTALPVRYPDQERDTRREQTRSNGVRKVTKTNEEWKQTLTPEQYQVMREKGTERPFSSPLNEEKDRGTFLCAGCGLPLFSSEAKYESGSGWPSFWKPISEGSVREEDDDSLWQKRTEVLCASCDAHLGHVFPDGPRPTGLRYCMNGMALKFVPEKE